MNKIYETASTLASEGQKLADELFKFNPSFEGNNKKSLATLAGIARESAYKYMRLQEDLIHRYERDRRHEIVSSMHSKS